MSSSVREKMAAQIKEAKRSVLNAINERLKPNDDKQEHSKIEVGGSPAEASSGDSSIVSKEPPVKKAPSGWVSKKIQPNRKTPKV